MTITALCQGEQQGDYEMANIKSAMKRVRTSKKARTRNTAVRSAVTTARRSFLELLAAKDKEKIGAAFRHYCSVMDKAAKKGVIKKQKAVRRKRRAAAQIIKLG